MQVDRVAGARSHAFHQACLQPSGVVLARGGVQCLKTRQGLNAKGLACALATQI